MSVDTSITIPDAGRGESLPEPDTQHREAPEPVAHGSKLMAVFNDVDPTLAFDVEGTDEDTNLYQAFRQLWYHRVGNRDLEPFPVVTLEADNYDWLPDTRAHDREWVLLLTSSSWMAGTGEGDDYRAWYDYHLKLRERDSEGEYHKPPLAIHIEIHPQFEHLVHKDGDPLECPYGEGTRVMCATTWADEPEDVERRMLDCLNAVVGADTNELWRCRNYDSRRIVKAEAHHRFDIGWKRQVVETMDQTRQLIAFGGSSEIESHQKRQKEGWLEALVESDRWDLLGFEHTRYDIGLKLYQAGGWHKMSPDEPGHHPKLEAFFAGVDSGAKPHVDDWDDVMAVLRSVVSAHLEWAGVDRENLVADEYQPGPGAPAYNYPHPSGRREQLRKRWEAVSTELYREAMKSNTTAVYDILRTLAIEKGATYDMLEERTGLARSTIRYHVRRMVENGVVDRVGNPVIVVFPSLQVLEDAEEILRRVFPDDTHEEQAERADERRERRESNQRDDGADDSAQEGSDEPADEPAPDRWRYFADVDLTAGQLAAALDRDHVEGDDVRIRTGPYDWIS